MVKFWCQIMNFTIPIEDRNCYQSLLNLSHHLLPHIHALSLSLYIYIYIYVSVCLSMILSFSPPPYIYIYIYIYCGVHSVRVIVAEKGFGDLSSKSWTRLFIFQKALIPLEKIGIQLFSLEQWVSSRADCSL